MRMKQKMIEKGKVSASESEGSGDDEFAEFMRWKQQKRRAARRGYDDWDQDDWGGPPKDTRPVNRSSSSGYSSGYNRIGFSTLHYFAKAFLSQNFWARKRPVLTPWTVHPKIPSSFSV